MCTYPLQKHKHKHKTLLQNSPVLIMYIPYTKRQTYTQRNVDKVLTDTCVHILYNKKSTNAMYCFQNSKSCMCTNPLSKEKINTKDPFKHSQSYMCKNPLKQPKHKQKRFLTNFLILHVYIPSTTTQS